MLKRINDGEQPTPPPVAPPGPRTIGQRIGLYLVTLSLLWIFVGVGGALYFEASECSADDFEGECDLVGLAGVVYASVAVTAGVVLVILWEILRAVWRYSQGQRDRSQL